MIYKKLIILLASLVILMAHPMLGMSKPKSHNLTPEQQKKLDDKLFNALFESTCDKVQRYLDKGANPNARNKNGKTVLIRAVITLFRSIQFRDLEEHHLEKMKLLLDAGADVNECSSTGYTPLHYVYYAPLRALFLARGANPNIRDRNGQTAIFQEVSSNNQVACIQLIDAGADLHIQDKDGITPFFLVKYHETSKFLVHKQQEINDNIITALLCFKRMGATDACAKLLYRERNALLLPYIQYKRYASLRRLLAIKNCNGQTAYENSCIECLNPENYRKDKSC